jgi:hypothetical protein
VDIRPIIPAVSGRTVRRERHHFGPILWLCLALGSIEPRGRVPKSRKDELSRVMAI